MDVPFDYTVGLAARNINGIKVPKCSESVKHIIIKESFEDKRMSRSPGDILCSRPNPALLKETDDQEITCDRCKESLKRRAENLVEA